MELYSCYICNTSSEANHLNLYKTKSKHSATSIYDFILNLLKNDAQFEKHIAGIANESLETSVVCVKCLEQIDEYDLACVTAQRAEKQLLDLLLKSKHSREGNDPLNSQNVDVDDLPTDDMYSSKDNNFAIVGDHEVFVHELRSDNQLVPVNVEHERSEAESLLVELKRPSKTVNFKCAKCTDGFHTKTLLKKHMRMHTAEEIKNKRRTSRKRLVDKIESATPEALHEGKHSLVAKSENLVGGVTGSTLVAFEEPQNDEMSFVKDEDFSDDGLDAFVDEKCESGAGDSNRSKKQEETDHAEASSQIETQNYAFKCSKCSDGFHYKTQLKTHFLRQHRNFEQCKICLYYWKDDAEAKVHKDLHVQNSLKSLPFYCVLCVKQRDYRNRRNLVKHVKLKHTTIEAESKRLRVDKSKPLAECKYVCPKCPTGFNFKDHLMRHIAEHNRDKKKYRCTICLLCLNDGVELAKHNELHERHQLHQCVLCFKTFTTEHNHVAHVKVQHAKRKNPFETKCYICGFELETQEKLSEHVTLHESLPKLRCIFCKQDLKTRTILKVHVKRIMRLRKESNKWSCCICSFELEDEKALGEHIEQHQQHPMQCLICKVEIKSMDKFTNHVRTHLVEKPIYQCDRCGKQLRHKGELEYHMAMHDGSRKFQCDICKRKFRLKLTLKNHIMTHTSAKPYSCSICGKKFNRKNNCVYHERIHSGAGWHKKLPCEFCERTFTRKTKLKEHLNNDHGALSHADIMNHLKENI